VAGIVARNRKQELLDLNLKLRQINAELRKRTTGGGVRTFSPSQGHPVSLPETDVAYLQRGGGGGAHESITSRSTAAHAC